MAYDDSNPAPRGELAAPTLARIEAEVRDGLPNEQGRIDGALRNLAFSKGDFSLAPVRPPSGMYSGKRFPRHSMLMGRVARVLSANLYRKGPTRTLPDHPKATEWLESLYRKHLVDAMFQEADRLGAVSDVAMFQASGTDDPDCPVKIQLWDSSCFNVWAHPDDPTKPVAVAVIDRYDNQKRIRLWTLDEVQTWLSEKLKDGQTTGGRVLNFISSEPNPYGVLPFCFVHFHLPISGEFWAGGPGTHLGDVNDGFNYFLTEHYDCIRYNTRPVITGTNVRPGWQPPSMQPGAYWDVPSASGDIAGNGAQEAKLGYLQADVSFIAAGWDDFNSFLDHTLEMEGIPPSTIRLEQTGAKSGYAIVVEQIPLILWAETRQRPFGKYEDDLAKLVLTVGAAGWAGDGASEAELAAAARKPGMVLRWGNMYPDTPGPERNEDDHFQLDNGLASRTEVLMRRDHLTREEAEARIEQIAADLKTERKLLAEPEPAEDQEGWDLDDGEEEEEQDDDESDDDED
jgi:hypothetical protein